MSRCYRCIYYNCVIQYKTNSNNEFQNEMDLFAEVIFNIYLVIRQMHKSFRIRCVTTLDTFTFSYYWYITLHCIVLLHLLLYFCMVLLSPGKGRPIRWWRWRSHVTKIQQCICKYSQMDNSDKWRLTHLLLCRQRWQEDERSPRCSSARESVRGNDRWSHAVSWTFPHRSPPTHTAITKCTNRNW